MQTQSSTESIFPEQAGYFSVPGAHLYTVLHQVTDPVARVLLVGPFASERHLSYNPWVRWARYLAARRIEVLRYDYRGVGESTGVFEEMSFGHWSEDIQLLAGWMAGRSPRVPFILHGLEVGAILAGRTFDEGSADALLLWSPPANANQALGSTLRQWAAGGRQLYESSENRRSASGYIRELQEGAFVQVQGYLWSGRLWRDSFHFNMPTTLNEENKVSSDSKRPVKIVKLGKDASPLVKPFRGYLEVTDFSELYSRNFEWIASVLSSPIRKFNEEND